VGSTFPKVVVMVRDLSLGGRFISFLLFLRETFAEERHLLKVFLNYSKNILVFDCLSFSLSLVI